MNYYIVEQMESDSGVENNVATFALPTHGLVVGIILSPGISNLGHR